MRPRFGCKGALLLVSLILSGCGTTRWTDTSRTGTEQLLISDAMDRAVSEVNFRALSGRKVYLDSEAASGVTDHAYLISSLRQHLLASGCVLRDSREAADCIVELRVGAVGTDTHKLTLGVPAVEMPSAISLTGAPSSIPEIPFAKKTEQRAVTKIALFAYERESGRPIWQSGSTPTESTAKDTWLLGMGPFRRGTIYKGVQLAGDQFSIPMIVPDEDEDGSSDSVAVADEVFFDGPQKTPCENDNKHKEPESSGKVIAAAHSESTSKQNTNDKKDIVKDGNECPAREQASSLTAPWPFRNGETMPPRKLPSTDGLPLDSQSVFNP